jgi:hypothetical protein
VIVIFILGIIIVKWLFFSISHHNNTIYLDCWDRWIFSKILAKVNYKLNIESKKKNCYHWIEWYFYNWRNTNIIKKNQWSLHCKCQHVDLSLSIQAMRTRWCGGQMVVFRVVFETSQQSLHLWVVLVAYRPSAWC